MATIQSIRRATGLTQQSFCEAYRIPLQTLKQWESNPQSTSHRVPPEYVTYMLERLVSTDFDVCFNNSLSRTELLGKAAIQTKDSASHWLRYLRKEFIEEGIRLSKVDIENLLKDKRLTMFQKVSLVRAANPTTPTGKYIMSLNEKAKTPMVDKLRRRFEHVEE